MGLTGSGIGAGVVSASLLAASRAGVALGTVAKAIDDLAGAGFLVEVSDERRLNRAEEILQKPDIRQSGLFPAKIGNHSRSDQVNQPGSLETVKQSQFMPLYQQGTFSRIFLNGPRIRSKMDCVAEAMQLQLSRRRCKIKAVGMKSQEDRSWPSQSGVLIISTSWSTNPPVSDTKFSPDWQHRT